MNEVATALASTALSYNDLLRTGPGTIAGRYLRAYWQPVYRADALLPGKARPLRIMDEDFTLYRGEDGIAHVVADRCPHRGAKLSLGKVRGATLSCAYHGWTFDSAGTCLAQPAEPRPFCDRVKLRAFPTEEYLGLIFAYLGPGAPPEFERTPEFDDPRYYRYIANAIWPFNYWAQLENTLDVTHTNFVHPQFKYQVPDRMAVEETEYGLKLATPGLSGIQASYDTHYLQMPNIEEYMAAPKPGEKSGYFARAWRVPRDDESFIWFDVRVYPLEGGDAEAQRAKHAAEAPKRLPADRIPELAQAMLRGETTLDGIRATTEIFGSDLIGLQDCTVMTSIGPMANRQHDDVLGPSDIGIAWLRKLWTRELEVFASGGAPRRWPRPPVLWEAAKQS
jgi:5,5'-dehydrodivanillate O-demethylase oxygenase subunit